VEPSTVNRSVRGGPRRVRAIVALRLLEVLRSQDFPGEVLQDEDPTRTIPRRFGLSDVVERQIRTYKDDVRRRVRLTDQEIHDLFRFVSRRPDGPEVFHELGRLLVVGDTPRQWVRILPSVIRYRVARTRARKRLRKLFGREVGGFGRGPFVIDGRGLLFIECDPGGDACHLLSGFSQEVLEQVVGGTATVRHTFCQSRGDDFCRWEGETVELAASVEDPVEAEQSTPETGAAAHG
jgi:hypothetical protein